MSECFQGTEDTQHGLPDLPGKVGEGLNSVMLVRAQMHETRSLM